MFAETGDAFHFLCDELGNSLALVDAGGTVAERRDYDARGWLMSG
jgi:hypothetical protein